MSHLALPRLHFRGDFVADVFTCNNDDIAINFPSQQFVDSANVTVDTFGMSDSAFVQWLRQLSPPFGIRAGWNLYGSGHCQFERASVQSAHPTDHDLIVSAADDLIVGATVNLSGSVMVDLDPEGTMGTQLFSDELSIRKTNDMRITGKPTTAFSRFVTRRNLGAGGFSAFSASWYAAIAPEALTIRAGGSLTLESFNAAHANGKGLFLAFCIYLLSPRVSPAQLAQDFAIGRNTRNPAIGKVIGTVGTWDPTEMKSIPTGRRMDGVATLQHNHLPFQLNPTLARVDRERCVVSLDLMNTFPEIDETLEKVNIGAIRLALAETTAGGTVITDIGTVAYDRTAYERESGMVDVAYDPSLGTSLDQEMLVLVQSGTNAIVLGETDKTIETDNRCVYLQDHESTQVSTRMLVKGSPPVTTEQVRLRQYVTSNRTFVPADASNAVVQIPDLVDVNTSGESSFAIEGIRPGTCLVEFLNAGAAEGSFQFFLNVRVLPEDDFDSIPDEDVDFALIYDRVLRYYHLIYPAMSEFIDLSDQDAVRRNAQFILDRIDKSLFASSRYMPVSRDMSDGKRRLLERWCHKVLGDGALA